VHAPPPRRICTPVACRVRVSPSPAPADPSALRPRTCLLAPPPSNARTPTQGQVQHPGPTRPSRDAQRAPGGKSHAETGIYIIYCFQLTQALRLAVEGALSTLPPFTTVKGPLDTHKPGDLHASRAHFQHKKRQFTKTTTTRLHKKRGKFRTPHNILHK